MTNQSTIDKLIEMRLTAMADAFRIQMDDPAMKEVHGMYGFLIYYWTYRLPGTMELSQLS